MVAPVVRSCTSLNSARDNERAADDDEDGDDDDEEAEADEDDDADEEVEAEDAYSAANESPLVFVFAFPLPLPPPTAARSLLAAAKVSRAASTLLSSCPSTSCSADRRRAAAWRCACVCW
jgi:hypothetical protein